MRRVPLLFLPVVLVGTSAMAQVITLRTIPQEGSAPKFMDATAATTGHCPDILAAIERADKGLRFAIEPQSAPIKRIENELKTGRIDVVCALLDTPLRNDIAYRVEPPIYQVQERLVGRREDNLPVRSIQELAQNGDVVVTQSGASYAADLRNAGVKAVESPGGSAVALRNVESGRARFYYTNALTGAYYIRAEGLGSKLRLHPGVLNSSPSYLWAGRHLDPSTVQRLEKALQSLKRSGELDRIYLRYETD
ncbi:transporter substrate-binding domain-containing protein [Curvibacter sp. APW13]|uniref:substrate-binding periplasmic protein n=1 Tax=Curvibacter sp. APW13 TaxID=3077236 RepID=UPI0028DE1D59|nr:transporter substrate-binding domain-containing protein [Curvibacter sp. APW13]MDT8989978.1 transporter substrate-binding domain-containing protein [Curvibacter sp. APW13]